MKKQTARRERWENAVAVVLTLGAGVIAIALGAPDKWLSAIFVTVTVFAGMLSFYWRRWSSAKFWTIMSVLFLAHLVLMWLVFGVVLRSWTDVGLLACVPGALVECFLIYHLVGGVLGDPESDTPQPGD
ncbi:MAG: hypothetical protein ACRD3E_20870 [Terriglobales bacterium]